jgi:VWFA-related protein
VGEILRRLESKSRETGRPSRARRGKMKRPVLIVFLAGWAALAAFSQEKHEVTVINISVPLTVLDGDRFVGDLSLDDLELTEEGVPQKILALYLISPTGAEKKGEGSDFDPALRRNYFLLFQITEYNPKLAEAIDFLFQEAVRPGDNVIIHTPRQNYALSAQALASKPRNELSKEMNNLLKKDIKIGTGQYNSLLNDLKRLARTISGTGHMDVEGADSLTEASGLEFLLSRYKETVSQMEQQRLMDERKILGFAGQLKNVEGQKNVFFIYQREFRPEIEQRLINIMISSYQDRPDILASLQDLFMLYSRDVSLNPDRIKQAFSDAGIHLYFIFMNKEQQNVSGITMREQSEDVFKVFSQVAQATGGTVDTSQNPAAGFQHALERSKDYYVLYYSPENYQKDGRFKHIKVQVKNLDYKVLHRIGYYAN